MRLLEPFYTREVYKQNENLTPGSKIDKILGSCESRRILCNVTLGSRVILEIVPVTGKELSI